MATGCMAVALLATACTGLPPQVPAPGSSTAESPAALDCAHWRYGAADEPAAGVLPAEYDRDNYKRTSLRDTRPELFNSPQNLCGQKGAAVDLAWGVDKGRDDVLIAVLDSGIMWRRADRMADLATAAYVNLGEARPPCAAATGDCDGNGVFDVADFGAIADRNGNGVADPEDLILDPKYSNGKDDDRNGYVDDISGWDFLYGDNDPLDTVEYGHGTGEAEDSNARENGTGDVGTCPHCRVLPVRVSDSFVAEGGRFAAGVLFALDSGADVVQEALGALTNPPQAQAAIDAAYDARCRRRRVDGRRGVEAPEPAGLARTDDGGELGHREGRPPHRGRNRLPRAERLHELRRSHVRIDPVRRVLLRGHGPVGRHGRLARIDRARRRHRTQPRPAAPRRRRQQRPVRERGHAGRARDRGRHRLRDAERRRSGQQLRHVDRRSHRHRALPDDARLGRDVRIRPHQCVRDREGGARRAHPARGRGVVAALVRRAADARHGEGEGPRRRAARELLRLPRRMGDRAPAAAVSRGRRVARGRARAPTCASLATGCSDRSISRRSRPRCPTVVPARRSIRRRASPPKSGSACGCASSSPRTVAPATGSRASGRSRCSCTTTRISSAGSRVVSTVRRARSPCSRTSTADRATS